MTASVTGMASNMEQSLGLAVSASSDLTGSGRPGRVQRARGRSAAADAYAAGKDARSTCSSEMVMAARPAEGIGGHLPHPGHPCVPVPVGGGPCRMNGAGKETGNGEPARPALEPDRGSSRTGRAAWLMNAQMPSLISSTCPRSWSGSESRCRSQKSIDSLSAAHRCPSSRRNWLASSLGLGGSGMAARLGTPGVVMSTIAAQSAVLTIPPTSAPSVKRWVNVDNHAPATSAAARSLYCELAVTGRPFASKSSFDPGLTAHRGKGRAAGEWGPARGPAVP